jgi:hypothetical protein
MRCPLLGIGLFVALKAMAQPVALPAWMQPSFAEGTTTTLPTTTDHSVKHNTFIGSYTVRITIVDTTNGMRQQLYLSAWQDSTRGIMQVEMMRGIPHNTWFADIGANMGVVANAIGRKAVITDLSRVLLVDRLRAPGAITTRPDIPLAPTGRSTSIANVECAGQHLVEGTDTMHVWTADISPSPFADGPAWIPLNEGVLKVFRFLFMFDDTVVFKFALPPLLELEVVEYHAGPTQPPVVALQGYEVIPVTDLDR